MDSGTISGIVTAVFVFVFIGIVWWAYSKGNKQRFEDAASCPSTKTIRQPNKETSNERLHKRLLAIYISVLTLVSIFGTWVFLKSQTTRKLAQGEKAELIEHTWDGDLQDFNNPLPRWWLGLFYGTMVFALAYLALWPGLGNFAGVLGWTSKGEYEAEVKAAEAKFQPVYAGFMQKDIATVAADPNARAIGKNLFLTYCSQCHGSNAEGARGFPNLTDSDWLYGGDPTPSWQPSPAAGTASCRQWAGRWARTAPRPWQTTCCRCRAASTMRHSPARSGQVRRELRRLPHARRHRHAGAGRAQPHRQGMAVWRLRSAIIETITKGRNGVMPAMAQTLGTTSNQAASCICWRLMFMVWVAGWPRPRNPHRWLRLPKPLRPPHRRQPKCILTPARQR